MQTPSLLILLSLADVLVCGDQTVRGNVGGSVTLRIHITDIERAYRVEWDFGNETHSERIAELSKWESKIDFLEKFRGRLQLDRVTGSLTITDLDVNDSGLYQVRAVGGDKFHSRFILNVYGPVSKPEVRKTPAGRALVTQNCSLLCSVQNGREVTLSWYREGEEKPLSNTSSLNLNSTLTLPLETDGQYNNTYSCVASNPVSVQTTRVKPETYCPGSDAEARFRNRAWVLVSCALLLCLTLMTALFILMCKKRRDERQSEGCDIQHCGSVEFPPSGRIGSCYDSGRSFPGVGSSCSLSDSDVQYVNVQVGQKPSEAQQDSPERQQQRNTGCQDRIVYAEITHPSGSVT
nr:PREDICTED: SLAM family member 8-like isoform X2 [Lepisosteus oculatus]